MISVRRRELTVYIIAILCLCHQSSIAQSSFRAIAFYTAREDAAHISFVHEANKWFAAMGQKYQFSFDSTNNWDNLNDSFLATYQLVIFLDTRPEQP
ncbi:MAG TPA: ThuA domain-containing protein, partial [Cyclobacteriaceae bacterium]|nr:ThuA domain-containing protein [Cyclobacteriaceae bacterium]